MANEIRNIYCIGRNYRLHALELGNEVPEEPLVFTKPSHAVAPMNGNVVEIPGGRGEVHFELELVLRIARPLEPGMSPDEIIDGLALGLDLTLRDVQSKLKAKGQPWLDAKGFKASAPLGEWMAYPGEEGLKAFDFALMRNGEQAQLGNSKDMLFSISELVRHIDSRYGLGEGDIIFTGTPAGVAALHDGDVLEALWNGEKAASCTVKLV
ncbi:MULTISPECIES: fumarylacetoacetate hydrolase family protein [unclassified Paenibacillus]|uniref:fumarylacetoacetate hydrolase family protein n=1 Tax=unclassified Paenibacillus TaxID=185978 RepID=UPI001048B44F|nr:MULTISPECIES: fumarylacetoacetate hydrolase family protein [unclassified Paenibacillus]NIK69546.1 2-keto-4-pentenoate hydratase/2-oxohepta-3-ene-1,7-dioic acid hydratase in catechol pathway [Paenibacillus sp. BK720]TCM95723.1 2-keto-4-pentenoate hydratase/2-oxohepta-3-ene-1,7-dioic acid hydratase in catechol pathway [Paenibacillus sp. BK033]